MEGEVHSLAAYPVTRARFSLYDLMLLLCR